MPTEPVDNSDSRTEARRIERREQRIQTEERRNERKQAEETRQKESKVDVEA